MQHLSIERQLARIVRLEESRAELKSTISRPTELIVFNKLIHGETPAWDIPVIRQAPRPKPLRYCALCRRKHPVAEFDRDKRNHDGLAFACRAARKDVKRRTWRRMFEVEEPLPMVA